MRVGYLVLAAFLAPAPAVLAQDNPTPDADSAAIIATARDYIDGFATGDTTRMRRALHPDLAKRQISGRDESPANQGPDDLVRITAMMKWRGSGDPTPADSIRILDRYRDIAMVRIGAGSWVDYLHVARFGSDWKIINVAWELRR
jgi:hypothetical protein